MAQISIIKYSDIVKAKRFDAEYFKPEFLKIEEKINSLNYLTIKDVSNDNVVYGTTPKDGEFVKEGVPFIKSEVLKHKIVFDENDLVYCTPEFHEKNKKSEVYQNDVLFSAVGATIGEVAIVKDIKKSNTNQNIARVRIANDRVLPDFVFIYFLSRFGNKQLERYKTGNAQPYLNSLQIKSFKVPILPYSFQLQIEKIVKQAYQNQSKSKELYKESEQLLLEDLGLVGYKPKHKLTFTATKKQVDEAGRFDAEYFQPKYAEIIEKIENYKGGWKYAGNILNIKDKNFTPEVEKEYKYIELSNISTDGNIEGFTKDIGKELPTRARRIVKTGDLIVSSIEGSLDSVALVTEEYNNSLCSTGFYVVDSEKLNSETLLVLTKSIALQMQLKKGCKGTILTAIPKDELKKIKIPIITPQIQNQIAEKIQESHRLRQEAKTLLEKAKKMVEEEIESRADVI